MKIKKLFIGITTVALLAMMISNVYAQECECPPGFTPGFWKHNIGVYLYGETDGEIGSPGHYNSFGYHGGVRDGMRLDDGMMEEFLGYVQNMSPGLTMEDAYNALTAHGYKGANLVRDAMANMWNSAAGYGDF